MTFAIEPGPIRDTFDRACVRLDQSRFSHALWTRKVDVWSTNSDVQRKIADRLGWLDAPHAMQREVPRLHRAADTVRAAFTDVVLIGMGGSSLAPEVLRATAGVQPGFPRFQVLDSVDPDAVRPALERAATTLFILASKSGSTIELTSIAAEAANRLRAAGVTHSGAHFIAITDEGTPLHRRAVAEQFRDAFINPSDIGGRFSAVSLFGLVPASLMGLDVEKLLSSAQSMCDHCRIDDPRQNPGLALGALLGAAAESGRDKMILALPPALERFGLWAEQLVAESTGKDRKGIVPILADGADPTRGEDRVVVAARLDREGHPLSGTSLPHASIHVPDVMALGAEFVRWEFATAAAGWLLGVNPFDEPNVQQAKEATRALLDVYAGQKRLPIPDPHAQVGGVRITLSEAARVNLPDGDPDALLQLVQPSDYVALLVYLPPDDPRVMPVLAAARRRIAELTGCVVSLGFGPRYLHSTGQLHKGGPNTGVFVIVTAEAASDMPVPGEPYSFGVLEMAQALGDFQSLDRLSRRAVHLLLPNRDPALLDRALQRIGVRSR